MLINILAALMLAAPVHAAAASQKILLPIVIETPVSGALDSLWSSEVDMYYDGSLLGPFVVGTAICHFDPCLGEGLVAKSTYRNVPVPMNSGMVGKFVYVSPDELVLISRSICAYSIFRDRLQIEGPRSPLFPKPRLRTCLFS